MAFRGGGRGRGRAYVRPEAFVPFPDIPALGKATDIKQNKFIASWLSKFDRFCKSSAYYMEDANECVKKNPGTELERFSTQNSKKIGSKAPLSDFINLVPAHYPAELAKGGKKRIADGTAKRGSKRVKWDDGTDMEDIISRKLQELESGKAKEKEEEEDEEDVEDEEDSEVSEGDGDYEQNIDFDDDEDDFNMPDDTDYNEPIF